MKLSELEAQLLQLGPSFTSPAGVAHSGDAIRLDVDDVDFTVVADAVHPDRVTVCCLFGPVPSTRLSDVMRGVVARNVDLMRQRSSAAFGVCEGDLIYAFSTEVSTQPEFIQALGQVMRSAASSAMVWQQSV